MAQLRRARGVTQERLSERARINYRHYQEIEAGKTDVKLSTLLRIARALGISPSRLFDDAVDPSLTRNVPSFREILDQVPYGIQINDLSGFITYSNPAHRALHGYSSQELIGKKKIWNLVATHAERIELKAYFARLCRGTTKAVPYFTRNRRKDGSVVEVRVDWRYLYDKAGKVNGFISGILPIGAKSS